MVDALRLDHVSKHFGALRACDGVSLAIPAGQYHGLIGPNGAGKSTLIGLITGEIKADQGRILVNNTDVTHWSVAKRARHGLGRSFQITQLVLDMSALDNVALAVQAQSGHSLRFFADARQEPGLRQPALQVLEEVGLGARANVLVQHLSHGERRQLEVAVALALRPQLLVLDEPMAGMGPHESAGMVEVLARLRGRLTLVLVEHDMDVVFALADRISVMVAGQILLSGDADEVRADARVRAAYLGEGHDAAW
jgi:branched-chain amino acid transport system ATP-binding protein